MHAPLIDYNEIYSWVFLKISTTDIFKKPFLINISPISPRVVRSSHLLNASRIWRFAFIRANHCGTSVPILLTGLKFYDIAVLNYIFFPHCLYFTSFFGLVHRAVFKKLIPADHFGADESVLKIIMDR